MGIGIEELRSVGLCCQSIMQAELNRLFMRRVGTFIGAGCHHHSTKSAYRCIRFRINILPKRERDGTLHICISDSGEARHKAQYVIYIMVKKE